MEPQNLEITGKNGNIEWRVSALAFQPGMYSATIILRSKGSTLREIADDLQLMALALADNLNGGDHLTTE